ncbi:MAG TPA: MiaB/RimO family radical SAM methylthiotransferase [Candidatus Omnitrophota bacterium]|nr:MiaB/RimO family radical SAM methylthiotransferase [Candidatus Omnitrophota bacterium]HQQ06294.1 MiaB/RimO family radical SAM methylthiotransferase [Candidatus Omnitrophota bacterium]
MKKARIGIVSLGCVRNLADSETVAARLASKGYPIVDMEHADIAVVNTCAFVNDAKSESISAILDLIEAKKKGRIRKIIVYGCFAQRYRDIAARELPEVDAFVGTIALDPSPERFCLTPRHFAYLKICEGCVNLCSFCVIPALKGRLRSIPVEAAMRKCKRLDAQGISELNIVGQDITAYGMDRGARTGLYGLLKKILKSCPHIGWFRLLYMYPSRISPELLRLIADEPRLCKYIDVPVQHISGRILKRMNRTTTKDDIMRLMGSIRRIIPGAAIRTTLITGFPGETDRDFREMLSFVRDMQFERLGVFMYSREEGTRAHDLPGQVPYKVKEARFNELMSAQQGISREINSRYMGKEIRVLIDGPEGTGMYVGRSEHDAPDVDGNVFVRTQRAMRPGEFVDVRVNDTMEYDLVGEPIR